MVAALTLALAFVDADNTFNYAGKLSDFLTEGAAYGMPSTGLPVTITIGEGGKITLGNTAIKAPEWKGECKLDLSGLTYANGELKGTVGFKNTSGLVLEGLRFDVVSSSESYKTKDANGKETLATRSQTVTEESPILFGDLPPDTSGPSTEFAAMGLKWSPETTEITVTVKLSGLAYLRNFAKDHFNSSLVFDNKGRLIIGSGNQEGIYRFDPASSKLELLASVPGTGNAIDINPVDGTIVCRWMNSHFYKFLTAGGDDKGQIDENGDIPGMDSWPGYGRYDAKGNLWLTFGTAVSKMEGGKPTEVVKSVGGFDFAGNVLFDLTPDGKPVIASEANVFMTDANGKNGRKLIQGPDVRIGRTHGVHALRVDPAGNIWLADDTDNEFAGRAQIFDKNGKFITVFGRGSQKMGEDINIFSPGQISMATYDFAFAPNGHVFLSGSTEDTAIFEFAPF